ncbi:transposase [Paraburkholderia dipogonis]|uniref:transposase n=1 Tax=Paraburkholderia dipogonis TaxID=1211383 RepID=UPI0038BB0940
MHSIFNYILQVLYMGCQWQILPIERDAQELPQIQYIRIYSTFRRWQAVGCIHAIFAGSVLRLHDDQLLDLTVIHGDGTTTAANKGGDILGYSGHNHPKADKVVALRDRHCNVTAPFVTAAGNSNESPLLHDALPRFSQTTRALGMHLQGVIVSLDGVYDCPHDRPVIFNRGMVSNISENPRARVTSKCGRKRGFNPAMLEERLRTIQRVFAWADKFRRLLLRFERVSEAHCAFKTLAYTMINLRHYRYEVLTE